MMGRGMMLGEVIGVVVETAAPVDDEFAVGNAIFDPVETHVDGFGSALFDGVVGDSGSTSIIRLDGGRSLWVSHL